MTLDQIQIKDSYPVPFNSSDVQKYAGKTIVTENNRRYSITQDGRLSGRKNLENSKIKKIGGLSAGDAGTFETYIYARDRRMAEFWLANYGYSLKEDQNLCLAVIISEEDEKRTGKLGLITSKINKIGSN